MFIDPARDPEVELKELIDNRHLFPDRSISGIMSSRYGDELSRLSLHLLHNGSIGEIPGELRSFTILNIVSNRIVEILDYITQVSIGNSYDSYSLGLSFGRSVSYPGGAYSAVFILKNSPKHSRSTPAQLAAEVLNVLNRNVKVTRGKRFKSDKTLAAVAARAVSAYFKGESLPKLGRRYNILAYQTVDLNEIPEEYLGYFHGNNHKRTIGISVLIPEKDGIPANYYLLAFVFRN